MFNKQQLCDIEARLATLEGGSDLGQITDDLAQVRGTVTALESSMSLRFKQLTLAVAEGIEKVERSESRVNSVVKRARKEFQESGYTTSGFEAEDRQLRTVDGAGGEEQGMPPVREDVAAPATEPSSVPGVPLGTLQRVRGAIL